MNNSNLISIALAISVLLFSCSADRGHKQADVMTSGQNTPSNQAYEQVSNDLVCMVNDRYMGTRQIPVIVEGITYYGCCEGCVTKLKENIGGVRFATDPTSGEKADKASAEILRRKTDGSVYYFESDSSMLMFLAQR